MKSAALLVLASAALLFTGCTNVNTVQRAQPEAAPSTVADQRIITDKSLGRALSVVSVNESKVSGNLLKIQVTLENHKNSTRTYKYKFEWIGDDGMEVSSPANSWRVITFQGREVLAVSAVSTSPRAVDFRLKLQEP